LLLLGFAATFFMGRSAESHSNWWFLDAQSPFGRAAFKCTWAVLLPLFFAWTILGMSWLFDTMSSTPDCMPPNGYLTPTNLALFQVFCIVGATAYVVFVANVWDAQRCRRTNAAAIASVEDSDLVGRWGQLSPKASLDLCGGLLPHEMAELPRHTVDKEDGQCVVCLSSLDCGDCARSLPGCGHVFHRACIDLWLLRHTNCPLCKMDVRFAEP